MSKYIVKAEQLELPVIPLRNTVAYPSVPMSFEITRAASVAACEAARANNLHVFLIAQRASDVDAPGREDLYDVGTVAKIKQAVKGPDGNYRLIVECLCRATILDYRRTNGYDTATVMSKSVQMDAGTVRAEALTRETLLAFEQFLEYLPSLSKEILYIAQAIKNPGQLADFIASSALVRMEDKQQVLDEFEPLRRLERLTILLENESKLLKCEMQIHRKVHEQLDQNQRDYYLREQMKVIQNELGDGQSELDEYYDRVDEAQLPDEVREKLYKEIHHLSRAAFGSPEATVLRNYLDVCLDIPWQNRTKDRVDIGAAKKILDRDHDGLEKIKERILEFLAVKQLNPELGNQIICLVGPPGVGKTSLGVSIAHALRRKYVRVSLGGIRDEADIRGHRKTYVGAMPGRIINALCQCGSSNPLMLLDEIDKIGHDAHGDPASALLEVLDGEQNKAFRDHFVEIPVDLSGCLFIATANTLETIPAPLIDRMEIIELHTYTRHEKLAIAKNHLIAKQLKRHGLTRRNLRISDKAILELIDYYTREAGVRNLERKIAALCRKAAKRMVEEQRKTVTIDASNVSDYLGGRKYTLDRISPENEVGVVNGLAYTEVGGDLLKVEAAVMDGSGKLELTGTLGDVMKESAKIAISYIRAHADTLGIDPSFATKKDIHLHVPEGAVPKDGPSAGVTMLTALTSALSGTPVRRDIAMTGELTLTGRVLAIGGLKEKTMAAYSGGVHTVLIPEENLRDLDEIDPLVRASIQFIPCRRAGEVLSLALESPTQRADAAALADTACVISPVSEYPTAVSLTGKPKSERGQRFSSCERRDFTR